MYAVKNLRNLITHDDFPVLHEWDPDQGQRSFEELKALLTTEIPEGYQFIPSKKKGKWVYFDCRDYTQGSLKKIPFEDRFAVIQFFFVIDIFKFLFK